MTKIGHKEFIEEVLKDYRLAFLSRELSNSGRKEVLNGFAKFGILGGGKEVPQIAMSKFFQDGDWRSGYYRDQTFMLAVGGLTPKGFFAQLYGDTSLENNPSNGGRLMNNHYASRNSKEDGTLNDFMKMKNNAGDISPTAGQIPRLAGLGYASKLFRNHPELSSYTQLSDNGNEVVFGTIGDASTSEGHFWETLNHAAVTQIPVALSVWDDGWGISVPTKLQTVKESISKALKGFEKGEGDENGILIYRAKGWDYKGLCQMYAEGVKRCREEHIPVLFHVEELTQPNGHSTSGSHERYKTKERLEWEREYDCLKQMREWILKNELATEEILSKLEAEAIEEVKIAKKEAKEEAFGPVKVEKKQLRSLLSSVDCECLRTKAVKEAQESLERKENPVRGDIVRTIRILIRHLSRDCKEHGDLRERLIAELEQKLEENRIRFNTHLYSESEKNPLKVKMIPPVLASETRPGREILRENFKILFKKYPLLLTFGEDTGKIGGVNQSLEGLQEEFGALRVADTGIREATIVGQGIGLAMRGLRPIAEIQYFDYIMYAIQTLSDDLATLHYRTVGGQSAPLIIRTRGHRLEGIWHAGSPLSLVINSIRGIYVCVPRNMTQAAGFYNTLLQSDNPALVIEPLNAYRLHEALPENLGEFTTPLGIPEVIREGADITVVTYGACVQIVEEAASQLEDFDIDVEIIDVQTLLPFDVENRILESLRKTRKVLFFDEDVPGGATSYMMQRVLEKQEGYYLLETKPRTLTARSHRPAYGNDGDYFSKPNAENVFDTVYEMMNEAKEEWYPELYATT